MATDNAGNAEATPTAAEASTQVVVIATTTTLQSSEEPSKLGDSVTFTATVTPSAFTSGIPTGAVEFSIDGIAIGDPVLLDQDGVADLTISSLAVGSHTVTADYINTDGYFTASSGSLAAGQIVNTADTTAVVDSTTATTVFGQFVTFTASVTAVTAGLPIPTGTVEFLDGGTDLATVTLDASGTAAFTTSAIAAGTHSITVQYMGDPNFSASTSFALTQTVNQTGTAVALVSSPSPSVYGQMVTFTVTIGVVAPGAGTPSGTVVFQEGSTVLDTETLGGSGTVNFATSALAVGSNSITAVYSGDANFATSSSTTSATVNQGSTTTSLSANPSSSVFGQTVTFTASIGVVSPGAGTPTGTVTFQEGSTVLDTETLGAGGTVSFTTSALAVRSSSITAVYSGDASFVTSSSSTNETVSQANTTTGLSATPPATTVGMPVTLTATIAVEAPGTGTPTGSVQFFDGTISLGTATLSGNTAVLTTTALPVGSDSLTAQYLGDSSFSVSTSSAVSVTISPVGIATTTTLASSLNPSIFGQSVTFTANVAPSSGNGTPTGTVTFYAGSTALGTSTLSGRRATLRTTSVPVGSQAITAVYSGDATYSSSTSAVLSQTVNQDSTTSSVRSSANPSVYGQSVTYTATVRAASPGSGTPTGTVTFYDGTTDLGSGTLSSGTATLAVHIFRPRLTFDHG